MYFEYLAETFQSRSVRDQTRRGGTEIFVRKRLNRLGLSRETVSASRASYGFIFFFPRPVCRVGKRETAGGIYSTANWYQKTLVSEE